jgi:cytoskeletal protein RodZ
VRKIINDQPGIVLIPIIAGVLLMGVAGTVGFSRVKQAQLNQQQAASSNILQDSISDSSKKLTLKEEQAKTSNAGQVKAPATVEEKIPAAKTTQKTVTTTTKPIVNKPETQKIAPTQPTGTLNLISAGGKNVGWTLDGNALYGLKLVWSATSGPAYPGSNAKYYPAGSTTSASVDAEAGSYYVRVCMYYEGKCLNYSNEIYITIP